MQIGKLTQVTGLAIDTIRFYEKRGLLVDGQHFVRKGNRYRDYTDTAVERLLLVKQGQAAGLTLTEIAESIDAWETNTLTMQQKIEFFEHKLIEIDERIERLEQMKRYIGQKLVQMREMDEQVLEALPT